METPQFPLDESNFGLSLVLEHHDLRKMDDGGRCVMSKIKPLQGMANAGNEGVVTRTAWSRFTKTCVFLMEEKDITAKCKKKG